MGAVGSVGNRFWLDPMGTPWEAEDAAAMVVVASAGLRGASTGELNGILPADNAVAVLPMLQLTVPLMSPDSFRILCSLNMTHVKQMR